MKREVIIGIFGLITLAGFAWGYKFLEGKNIFGKENYYSVSYDNVASLGVSSEVQIKGFKVGNVTDINLDPNDVEKIKVTFSVKAEIKLPKSTIAAIRTGGVMGEKNIELIFNQVCTTGCAEDGDVLKSGTLGLMQTMLPEKELDIYINKLTSSAKGLVDDIKGDSTSSPIKETIANLEATSLRLALMTSKINRILDRSAKSIESTLTNSASITNNLADNNQKITNIISNLETTLNKVNGKLDETFDNTNGSIKSLKTSLETANLSFVELNKLLGDINKGEGTMNKLVHDKAMADDLQFALDNLGLLLQDMRLNPKRYINVSVFGKKQKNYNNPDGDPAFIEKK